MRKIKAQDFVRIDNDINGNPRYYIEYALFYDVNMSDKKRLSAGLEKYRGKKYGSGFVVQSYNLEHTADFINQTLALA